MLTYKAKIEFEDYYNSSTSKYLLNNIDFDDLPLCVKNALIIEWFDSIGYTIDRDSYNKKMTITNWTDGLENQTVIDCDYLTPFNGWYESAIEKANEIYNI